MRFKILLVGIAFTTISVSFCIGQSPAESKSSPPSLSGTIVDNVASSPIAGANVWIHEWSGKSQVVVQSDKAGHYMANLPNGVYFVLIGSEGFVPICKSVLIETGKPVKFSVRMFLDTVYQLRD